MSLAVVTFMFICTVTLSTNLFYLNIFSSLSSLSSLYSLGSLESLRMRRLAAEELAPD